MKEAKVDEEVEKEVEAVLLLKYHKHSLTFSLPIMITIMSANVMEYIWAIHRFEDKVDSDHAFSIEAQYKVANFYDGDKELMRKDIMRNI